MLSEEQDRDWLYVSGGKNSGALTTTPTEGRKRQKTSSTSLWDILNELRPSIVKIDCEGDEYGMEVDLVRCKAVHHVMAELHFKKKCQFEQAQQFHKTMNNSFEVLRAPDLDPHDNGTRSPCISASEALRFSYKTRSCCVGPLV